MATPFASRDAKISAAIDRAFGESFTFLPFKAAAADINLPKIPDTTRATFIATGVWEGAVSAHQPTARGMKDDWAHKTNVSMPSVTVADENIVWAPQPGDRVIRNFDSSLYHIAAPMPDGMGRTTFLLTARKR